MVRLVAVALSTVLCSACSRSPSGPVPPPISGGTLLVTRDLRIAVAADPDRDRLWIVDVASRVARGSVALQPGDEPGRAVEDAAGHVWVALRRGGALAVIDPSVPRLLSRFPVCAAPRGLAFDAAANRVHVACADGALVSLSLDGTVLRRVTLPDDLRDVVVAGGGLLVSRFRSAEVLVVDPAGRVSERLSPPSVSFAPLRPDPSGVPQASLLRFEPDVAWRMAPLPGGGAALIHQRAQATTVSTEPGGYGTGECRAGVVHATVSLLHPPAAIPASVILPMLVVPVDVAVSADGQHLAAIGAGNAGLALPEVLVTSSSALLAGPVPPPPPADGGTPPDGGAPPDGGGMPGEPIPPPCGSPTALLSLGSNYEAVAVAFAGDRLLIQTREPAVAVVPFFQGRQSGAIEWVRLGVSPRPDTGHRLFHASANALIACASCHPEGGDDGRVWDFSRDGPRRTQSLRGGILATAPFHWSGDLPDLEALLGEVLMRRMGGVMVPGGPMGGSDSSPQRPSPLGPGPTAEQVAGLGRWLDALPAPAAAAPSDAQAARRGRDLFESPDVGCASCHAGVRLTDNRTVDVGTGGRFQVPSLVGVRSRAPYLHNGCAKTLGDRFGPCGGGDRHGVTSHLSRGEIDDLVAYMETL